MLAYQRVYKQILQALKDNTYPIGSLLPAEPELEKIYGVSRTTVRRAIAQLAEEGYVKVKQGHGTIVLKSIYPTDAFEYSRLHHFEDILSIRHVNIPRPFLKFLKSRWEQWYTGSNAFFTVEIIH